MHALKPLAERELYGPNLAVSASRTDRTQLGCFESACCFIRDGSHRPGFVECRQ
jgi:hypothetical protein